MPEGSDAIFMAWPSATTAPKPRCFLVDLGPKFDRVNLFPQTP
jgi:hypothetical protein